MNGKNNLKNVWTMGDCESMLVYVFVIKINVSHYLVAAFLPISLFSFLVKIIHKATKQ